MHPSSNSPAPPPCDFALQYLPPDFRRASSPRARLPVAAFLRRLAPPLLSLFPATPHPHPPVAAPFTTYLGRDFTPPPPPSPSPVSWWARTSIVTPAVFFNQPASVIRFNNDPGRNFLTAHSHLLAVVLRFSGGRGERQAGHRVLRLRGTGRQGQV